MHVTKSLLGPLTASFLFVLGIGCGGPQQQPPPPVTIATTSPSAVQSAAALGSTETTPQETPATPAKSTRCAPDGYFPPLAPVPAPAAPLPCRPAEVTAEKMITTDMKVRYQPTKDKSTVEVKFACDALDRVISRVVLESSARHGAAFHIIEISRSDPNTTTYDVLGVRVSPTRLARPKTPFEIMRSTVSQEAVFAWMPLIRAALRTSIEEIEPKPDPKSHTGTGSAFGSSSNIHVLVRMEDAAARTIEKYYTGYESSDGQAHYLPLLRAQEVIEQAIGGLSWQADSPTEEFKLFFERRFGAAQKRFSDSSSWWIRERYATLAAYFGTRALIPSLLPFLTPTAGDASGERTRDQAFEALVVLTGWDPRAPKNGEAPRTAATAANDFIEECGKVPVRR